MNQTPEAERVLFLTEYARINHATPGGGWDDFDAQSERFEEVDTHDAWLLWQAARAIPQAAAEPVADPRLEDLRYIVERLARKLAKADPDSGEPTGALAYLRRVGLTGSPLRAAPDRAPSIDSATERDAAQAELLAAVGKLVKAKGRFHTEQNYTAVAAAYGRAIAAMKGEG